MLNDNESKDFLSTFRGNISNIIKKFVERADFAQLLSETKELFINAIEREDKYSKKIQEKNRRGSVKSETLKFYYKLKSIKIETDSNNVELEEAFSAFIKALENFIKILSRQNRWFRRIWGHISVFAQDDIIKDLKSLLAKLEDAYNHKIKRIKGLPNSGNQCYMNSAIQQLYKLKGFRNDVINFNVSGDINTNKKVQKLCALKQLFQHLHGDINLSQKEIGRYERILGYNGQQGDSDEKMREIMDICEEVMNPKKPLNEYIIDELRLAAQDDNRAIETMILRHFMAEKRYKESIGVQYTPFTLTLNSSGKFIIYLSRGTSQNGKLGMTNCKVKIEETFILPQRDDLYKFKIGNQEITKPKFDLTGVTIKQGGKDAGHYYVYQKSGSTWVCKNDSQVSKKKWEDIKDDISQCSTVLVYKKV